MNCPLKRPDPQLGECAKCEKDECAWWDDTCNPPGCSMVGISAGLDDLRRAIENLKLK